MNFYKKISATPLPPGSVIDSFNSVDDKTTNAPSIRLVGDTFNANFAQEYSGNITYPKDSYCMHNKQLYKARVVTGDEDWNPSKWDATDVGTELKMINTDLSNNCIIGDGISVSVNWDKVGWTSPNNINNYVNTALVPSIDGYELAGFIVHSVGTYRICAPYVAHNGTGFVCHFYASDTSITSSGVGVRPIYKKV